MWALATLGSFAMHNAPLNSHSMTASARRSPGGPEEQEAARARDASVRLEPLASKHVGAVEVLALDCEVRCRAHARSRPPAGFARTWVGEFERGRRDATREGFAVVAAGDGSFLGVAAAVRLDDLTSEAKLALLLPAEARRDGVATPALERLTEWGFARGLHRLELRARSDDVALRRAAERCGYVREGLLRSAHYSGGRRSDVVVYSRLSSDD